MVNKHFFIAPIIQQTLITEDKILTEIALGLNIEVLSTSKLFSTTRHIETNTQKKPPLINNETDITT